MGDKKYNHGEVRTEAKGATIVQSFGKDCSDYTGSATEERGKKLKGDVNNLSHSLNGATAVQR